MALLTNSGCNDIINDLSLEILLSGYLQAGWEWNKRRSLPPHYAKLYFILGGDAYIEYCGVRYPLTAGHVYLIPTELVYQNGCETEIHFLYFNIRLTNRFGYDYLSNYTEMLSVPYDIDRIGRLVTRYRSENPIDAIAVKGEILTAVTELLATRPDVKLENRNYSYCVSEALAFIHTHLSASLTVADICTHTYTARSTLTKKFRTELGISVSAYIHREIMIRCEHLIFDTDLTVNEISNRFGFCDQFYFTRCFKARYGISPQKYREMRERRGIS